MQNEAPNGSVQALSSAAMSMLTIFLAYFGYTSLKSPNAWKPEDLFLQIIPAILAALLLVAVPLIATRGTEKESWFRSIKLARFCLAAGCSFALLGIFVPLVLDYWHHHNGEKIQASAACAGGSALSTCQHDQILRSQVGFASMEA